MKARLRALLGRRGGEKTLQERYPQYAIGRGSYGGLAVRDWGEGTTLRIGAFCSIAKGVQVFLGGNHNTRFVTTYPFAALWPAARAFGGHPCSRGDVNIGNDVWIGAEAVILSGVTVGDGAVVGARAVVSRDVAPYAIVAGNPAQPAGNRFPAALVARLLALRWWDWDDARIERALPLLLSERIEDFLDAAEQGRL